MRKANKTALLKPEKCLTQCILNNMDTKRHICRFNDGECKCECYIKGIKTVKRALKKWFKESNEPIEDFIKRI